MKKIYVAFCIKYCASMSSVPRLFSGNILSKTFLFGLVFFLQMTVSAQTTVIYPQQFGNYYSTFISGSAGIFNQGSYQVGMFANTSGAKQAVSWRKFRTDASGASTSDRSMQIGDKFVVTLSATRAYGRIGFALLASPSATSSYPDRENNYAISVNLDGPLNASGAWGNWYLKYAGGATTAAGFGGQQTFYKDFTFTCTLTAADRMNVSITDGISTNNFYDILLNTSNPITDYSIFLEDDYDGGANRNIYWGLGAAGTQHTLTNGGILPLGQSNTSFTESNIISNGLVSNSASSASINSLTKSGTGTLTLTGANTYEGVTSVNAGVLSVSSLANGMANSNIGASAWMTANLVLGGGTLQYTGSSISIDRGFTLATTSTIDITAPATSLSFSGSVGGAGGLIKAGTGTLMLSGLNNYSGNTTVNAGTLQAGNAQAFGVASAVIMANISGSNLDLNGYDNTIGSLTGGGSTGGNINVGVKTLTIGSDNTTTAAYAGVISGTGVGGITKVGTGTLIFSGANTYMGLTTASDGTLQLSNAGGLTIPATNNINIVGGTIRVSQNQTIADFTMSSGTLTVDAGKTLTITGMYNVSGGTINNLGTIKFAGGAVAFPGLVTLNSMANLEIANPGFAVTLTSALTISNNFTLSSGTLDATGSNYSLTIGGNWINNGGIFLAQSDTVTFNGTSAQTVGGTSSTTFYNLTVSGAGSSLILGNNQTVNLLLTLSSATGGNVDLNGSNNIILGSAAGIAGETCTRTFINNGTPTTGNGCLQTTRSLSTNPGNIANLGISITFATPMGVTTIKRFVGKAVSAVNLNGVNASIKRIYSITPATAVTGTGFTAIYSYCDAELNGNTESTPNLVVYKSTGTNETTTGYSFLGAASFDATGNTVTAPGTDITTGTTYFTLANTDKYCTNNAGDWNTASTWNGGIVPPTGANICINHAVTLTVLNPSIGNISINAGGSLDIGTGRTITIGAANIFTNNGTTASVGVMGSVVFAGAATLNGTQSTTFNNLQVNGATTFSTVPTINGNLQINLNGSVSAGPNYGASSTLIYNSGGTYIRFNEWNSTSGAGYPNNVQVNNNTILDVKGAVDSYKKIAGNLTINAGSAFDMNGIAVGSSGVGVEAGGNIVNDGTINFNLATQRLKGVSFTNGFSNTTAVINLSAGGSTGIGGDLEVTGNFIDNAIFNANARAVFFTGAGVQTVSGAAVVPAFNMDYIVLNKPSGTVQLGVNVVCGGPNGGTALILTGPTDILDLNGKFFTLGTAGVVSGISGTGVIRGSLTSTMSILGNGALGIVSFDQTTPGSTNALADFNIDRQGSGSVTLGTGFTENGSLNLINGVLDASSKTITFQNRDNPITNTNGTLTVNPSTNLVFGTAGNTGGAGFTLLSTVFTSSPVISSLTLNRVNPLNITGIELRSSLTLTAGTLNIEPGTLLNLNGASLTSSGGFLAGSNTSDLTVQSNSAGPVLLPTNGSISLRTVTIGGNRTLIMNGSDILNLYGSLTIASGATFDNGGESQIRDPGGVAAVFITGKFINRDKDNFTGNNGAIVNSISPTLNPGSIIEYGLATGGPQVVTSRTDYQNITFSGSGTKTLASGFSPKATVYITDAAIVDASTFTFGNSVTKLTMDGGRFRMAGTTTKPDMEGVYNLTGGVIEFYNSAAGYETINGEYGSGPATPVQYNQIEITGDSVANSNTNITLRPGGSFTVKNGGVFTIDNQGITDMSGTQTVTVENGGIFKTNDKDGFSGSSGGNATSVYSTIENIILAPGSTVEYSRDDSQNITNTVPYQHLTLSGTGTKTAPAATLEVKGNLARADTTSFDHNGGTVLLSGSTQAFAGLTYNNLWLDNAGTKTLTGNAVILDSVRIGNISTNPATTLDLANFDITLQSTASKTAKVGTIASAAAINYGTGRFGAERFYKATRSWRLITFPLTSKGTANSSIFDTWQNGGVYVPGKGMFVTGPGASNPTAGPDGLDWSAQNNFSLMRFSNNSYIGVGRTKDSTISNLSDTSANLGYFAFVRGDRNRSPNNTVIPNTNVTTLSGRGKLQTGRQTFHVNTDSISSFTLIGNPYPCPVDFNLITKNNVYPDRFTAYDPTINSVGVFVVMEKDSSGTFKPVDKPSSSQNNFIQSGQAFFVQPDNIAAPADLVFNESNKSVTGDNAAIFRPLGGLSQSFKTLLSKHYNDDSTTLADGVHVQFDDAYIDGVDIQDALKFGNIAENLALIRQGKALAVEKRPIVTENDTLFFNLTRTTQRNYRFQFEPENLDPLLSAFLEDSYTNTKTPVSVTAGSTYDFTVNGDVASASASRFRIVFKLAGGGPLPVTFSNIKAYQQGINIAVEWTVENELNISKYEVEKSTDGVRFNKVNTVLATGANRNLTTYNWLDVNALDGDNSYRIRSVEPDGKTAYSRIVNVRIGNTTPGISVYPNPVTESTIGVQLNNMAAGVYHLRLINSAGQLMSAHTITHAGGSSTETIIADRKLISGMYQLEVIQPGRKAILVKLLVK